MKIKKLVIFVLAAALISPSILLAVPTTPKNPMTAEMKTRKKAYKKNARLEKKQFKAQMKNSKLTKMEKKKAKQDYRAKRASEKAAFHKAQSASFSQMKSSKK